MKWPSQTRDRNDEPWDYVGGSGLFLHAEIGAMRQGSWWEGWRKERDSNPLAIADHCLANSADLPVSNLSVGARRQIRTDTVQGLSLLPLPIGLHAQISPGGRGRTCNKHGLNVPRLPIAPHRDMVGVAGIEPHPLGSRFTGGCNRH